MRAIEEEAATKSILEYDSSVVGDIETTITGIKKICQCEVKHLPNVHCLILSYPNSTHPPASTFNSIHGIVVAEEDEAIGLPDDPLPGPGDRTIASVRVQLHSKIKQLTFKVCPFRVLQYAQLSHYCSVVTSTQLSHPIKSTLSQPSNSKIFHLI